MAVEETLFFIGIGGSGMCSLAKLLAGKGFEVHGSDREFDRGFRPEFYSSLRSLGISLHPQDGSGITNRVHRVITSTAVEVQIPDMIQARQYGIPIVHRADELARLVSNTRSIAVSGTSGKSTVSSMVSWILTQAGFDPSAVIGARIPEFGPNMEASDFRQGNSDWFVFEADESDGTLVKFAVQTGVLLNLSRDHKPLPELRRIFSTFIHQINGPLVYNFDCRETRLLAKQASDPVGFGFTGSPDFKASGWKPTGWSSHLEINGQSMTVPLPGKHNAANALAAVSCACSCGLTLTDAIQMIASFPGVLRRFHRISDQRGITIVDDFAHNPDKIHASLQTAISLSKRLIVVFQPHGFGPTRFNFKGFVTEFSKTLRPDDILILTPIYYAGGTVSKDIRSEDLSQAIETRISNTVEVLEREQIVRRISTIACQGDLILVMGARDPSLTGFAEKIAGMFKS